MKKAGSLLLAVLLLTLTWLPTAATAASSKLPLRVEYQGNRIYFPDAQPFVDKAQRVQVPLRFVSEGLGAYVKWDSAVRTVYISKTPLEPEDEKKKEPAKDEKVVVENMHGFKVKLNTGSRLDIKKGPAGDHTAVISLLIYFPELKKGADYKKQE